jgi:hypothetical protein
MNERLKELAMQAGLDAKEIREDESLTLYAFEDFDIERFAELVRQDEREACAKLCEDLSTKWYDEGGSARDCVHAIRARGNRTKTSKDICDND